MQSRASLPLPLSQPRLLGGLHLRRVLGTRATGSGSSIPMPLLARLPDRDGCERFVPGHRCCIFDNVMSPGSVLAGPAANDVPELVDLAPAPRALQRGELPRMAGCARRLNDNARQNSKLRAQGWVTERPPAGGLSSGQNHVIGQRARASIIGASALSIFHWSSSVASKPETPSGKMAQALVTR